MGDILAHHVDRFSTQNHPLLCLRVLVVSQSLSVDLEMPSNARNLINILEDMTGILASINHRAGTNYDQRSKTEKEIYELKTRISALKEVFEEQGMRG